jgi:hypothetical protein
MNQKKTAGQTAKRVVLALSTEQAEELNKFLKYWATSADSESTEKLMQKISARIQKTLNNQNAKELGYPRGTKQMKEEGALELPGKVMEAISQVASEVARISREGNNEIRDSTA